MKTRTSRALRQARDAVGCIDERLELRAARSVS
jgi:hypothetical protein